MSDSPGSNDDDRLPTKVDKKRKWERGSTSSASKRAKQFPNDMEVVGDAMWCKFCSCPVKFIEKSTATKHVQSAEHLKNKKKHHTLVTLPGLNPSPVQSAPVPLKTQMEDIFLLPFDKLVNFIRTSCFEANGFEGHVGFTK